MKTTLSYRAARLAVTLAVGPIIGLSSGCGPFEAYRVRTEVRLDDAKLTQDAGNVDLAPVALAPGFRAGGKTSGADVERVRENWADMSSRIDRALAEQSTPQLRLVSGGTGSRYVLQSEVVHAASSGDIWFGYSTDVGVLCTLWDRRSNQVVDRFTVLGNVMGEWKTASADGVIAESVGKYLAARMNGRELDVNVDP